MVPIPPLLLSGCAPDVAVKSPWAVVAPAVLERSMADPASGLCHRCHANYSRHYGESAGKPKAHRSSLSLKMQETLWR